MVEEDVSSVGGMGMGGLGEKENQQAVAWKGLRTYSFQQETQKRTDVQKILSVLLYSFLLFHNKVYDALFVHKSLCPSSYLPERKLNSLVCFSVWGAFSFCIVQGLQLFSYFTVCIFRSQASWKAVFCTHVFSHSEACALSLHLRWIPRWLHEYVVQTF